MIAFLYFNIYLVAVGLGLATAKPIVKYLFTVVRGEHQKIFRELSPIAFSFCLCGGSNIAMLYIVGVRL